VKREPPGPDYTGRRMGSWYWIGVTAGLAVAIGVLLVGLLAGIRWAVGLALIAAAGAGVLVGLALGEWDEAVGGLAGGVLGAIGAAQVASGTLRRGGTRFGTAALMAGVAVVIAAIAWIPLAGYVEAALVPAFGARLRRRAPERYAGLRSLARD
jgi:hypothetical protein